MIIEILLVVALFIWFLSLLPVPQLGALAGASGWLAWVVAVLLTVYLFAPALR